MDQPTQTEVWKAQTLDELIEILHQLFSVDKVNVAEVQGVMESYESHPEEWTQFAQFDQFSRLVAWLIKPVAETDTVLCSTALILIGSPADFSESH
uniref:Uncharacterized protein n=1 Tax=Sphaerodactylus townsendi TaxID=933632 RepID=A0ACB8EQN0_9SAUR